MCGHTIFLLQYVFRSVGKWLICFFAALSPAIQGSLVWSFQNVTISISHEKHLQVRWPSLAIPSINVTLHFIGIQMTANLNTANNSPNSSVKGTIKRTAFLIYRMVYFVCCSRTMCAVYKDLLFLKKRGKNY